MLSATYNRKILSNSGILGYIIVQLIFFHQSALYKCTHHKGLVYFVALAAVSDLISPLHFIFIT